MKDGTDPDVDLISSRGTIITTIAEMTSWPKPSIVPPNNRISPFETTVWTVSATLVQFKLEADSDYHLLLMDAAGNTMIAEIPSPDCLPATAPLLAGVRNARAEFDSRFQPHRTFATANVAVQVTGVGMFDLIHGQTGVAPNGIEIHPVLDIQFDAASSGPDFAISASTEVVGTEQGGGADFSVFVDSLSGFGSTVSLSILGVPSGVTVSFPHSVTPGATSVGVTVADSVPAGSYSLILTGSAPEARRSVVLSLVVSGHRMPVVLPARTQLQRPVVVRH